MFKLIKLMIFVFVAIWLFGTFAKAQQLETKIGLLNVTRMASGFKNPWALAFLPDNSFLVTERRGRLFYVTANGEKTRVSGIPDVVADGQGGLLDVVAARDFADSREIFLTYAKRQGRGSGTAVAVARLDAGAKKLTNLTEIFEMTPGSEGGRHFGSRIVEAQDGTLFITIGERGDRPSAQDTQRHNGSIVRINRDGSVPADNPFVGRSDGLPEIWSYGHRNPQGIAMAFNGQIWAAEHGARGGDEINRIVKGANYGWPVIAYGRHYSGGQIGEGTEKPGMQQPAHYWDPSIAPSGYMIYTGDMFQEWKGQHFVGSLKFDYISRLYWKKIKEVEALKSAETKRVRDIRQAPDGSIWFISDDRGSVFRISR